jgi:hypothetical protein
LKAGSIGPGLGRISRSGQQGFENGIATTVEKETLTPVLPLNGGITMGLQERMDAYKKSFEAKAPEDVLEILHRATENLRNSGIFDRTVKVGDKAPDFSLRNTRGQEITLADQLSKGPVVLGFYRGRW